ncbi:MAG TPA: phosphoribosyltransferase [Devosiaceae bacterium]|nr:phosphoribosyltransferase [Devosiaceae bacterium]
MEPHEFWQTIEPAAQVGSEFATSFPVHLSDGRILRLPIRTLADGRHGLASLIINQASFSVQAELSGALAERLAPFAPEVVVGLPTLGLTLAGPVAQALGHSRYVPLGTSRKFWYDEALSVPLSSITTEAEKRLYIDPRLLPLISGRRVALVDDVISSGRSMSAALKLLGKLGVEPVVIGAAMLQTRAWQQALATTGERLPDRVRGVFSTPRLVRTATGTWRAEEA